LARTVIKYLLIGGGTVRLTSLGERYMQVIKRGLLLGLLLGLIQAARGDELPRALPEQVGLSSSKLEKVKTAVQTLVDKKECAGAVIAVARKGKVAFLDAEGMMDIEAGKPMRPDTIFRIYSMSKPITTAAAMILYDEGRFQLDDPVGKYLPELKDLRVHSGKGDETLPASREVSIRDMMRHTSGLTYGFMSNTPVDRLYRDRKVMGDPNDDLAAMVAKLGKLPLLYQPGTRFNYSVSVDVLGRLVEVVSGKPLDEFFAERIFKPLDMKDTGFFVPENKLDRLAANYGPEDKGGLKVVDAPAQSRYRKKPKLFSGGGGLVSTARDYVRFCQMMLNGGELEGIRILKAETVKEMTRNQLPQEARRYGVMGQPTVGFGLGFSVLIGDSPKIHKGEYGWDGAASTHFWVSPKDDLIVVALEQYMPFNMRLTAKVKPLVYEAITD
jgi:CubicO group peptidase (beta-lactamase class C family)